MKRKIFAMVAALFLPGMRILADLYPDPVNIYGISGLEDCRVVMSSETVDVTIFGDSSVTVCVFYMTNTGSDDVRMQIGFPDVRPPFTSSPDSYRFNCNGRRLGESDLREKDGRTWFVWDETFRSGETSVITVSYTVPHTFDRAEVSRQYKYILETGAGWYGNIGQADINVTLADDVPIDHVELISPAGYRMEGRKLTWQLRDFEPDSSSNIVVRFYDTDERMRYEKMAENRSIVSKRRHRLSLRVLSPKYRKARRELRESLYGKN
ncbi:MAG: hypothetical protein J5732_09730 [Bacteroidaceae bacterium]|nr:hypothetical protein [Bacteroidaceae bacterium]